MKKEKNSSRKGFWGTIGGISLLALAKMKWILPILKFTKVSTVVSMLLSVGAYGLVYGWAFGFSIVYLLLVHELGHYVACKIKGIPVKPTLFIPFLGAAVRLEKMPTSAAENAFIAYMGPVFGVLSIVPAVILYMTTHSPLWLAVISMGSILNLFNLIPFSILDGGKIVGGISPKLWFVGLILIIAYVVYSHSAMATVIAILGVIQLWSFYRQQKSIKHEKEAIEEIQTFYHELCEAKDDKVRFTNKIEYAYKAAMHIQPMILYGKFEEKMNQTQNKPQTILLESSPYEEEYARYLEAADEYLAGLNQWLAEQETYIAYFESHYTISKKSKWTTFAIYIALILMLSVSMDISTDLVRHNSQAQLMMHR